MAERRKFFKAVTTTLTGPHYGKLLYLPGSHHQLGVDEPFDSSPEGWCTAGLYVGSHRRVVARWGPVVLEVLKDLGAPLVRVTRRHKPTGVPPGVDSGSYYKYRTTGFTVLRIVGITVYASDYGLADYDLAYERGLVLGQLNGTLQMHGKLPVSLTGHSLERLRDDRYQLWEVHDPNATMAIPYRELRVRHRVELEFEASRQLTEAEIYSNLGQLRDLDIYPGSQRIVSMR